MVSDRISLLFSHQTEHQELTGLGAHVKTASPSFEKRGKTVRPVGLETQSCSACPLLAFLRELRLNPHDPRVLCQKLRENGHIQSVK